MTGEEMERAIAFILQQQAQFAANQQRHEERMRRHEEVAGGHGYVMSGHEEMMRHHDEVMRHHEEMMRRHEEVMGRVEAAQEQTALQVQHLSGAMMEMAEAHTRTEAKVGALADRLAETDERLNALIDTVERHVSQGRNGKA